MLNEHSDNCSKLDPHTDISTKSIDLGSITERINTSTKPETVWGILHEICEGSNLVGICCRCFPGGASTEQKVFFSTTKIFEASLSELLRDLPAHKDPFLLASVRSSKAFRWRDLCQAADLKCSEAIDYQRLMLQIGTGVVAPVFGPYFRNGYFCFHADNSREISDLEITLLHSIAQTSYLKLNDLMYRAIAEEKSLSNREREIINLIAKGRTNAEISIALQISQNTVSTYVKRVFEKLDVSDRASAAMRALSLGYVA